MEYPYSGLRIPSLLTEEEKWLFDLNGFLIKKNAVNKEKMCKIDIHTSKCSPAPVRRAASQ